MIQKTTSDPENRIMKITQSEQQIEKQIFKNKSNLRDLWGNIKHTNICSIGVPGEEKEKRIEHVFEEIMSEKFQNLKGETDIQVQEAKRIPNKVNLTDPQKDVIIKMAKFKDKETILKVVREKQSLIQGNPHKAIS